LAEKINRRECRWIVGRRRPDTPGRATPCGAEPAVVPWRRGWGEGGGGAAGGAGPGSGYAPLLPLVIGAIGVELVQPGPGGRWHWPPLPPGEGTEEGWGISGNQKIH